jgi:hypothetical protein
VLLAACGMGGAALVGVSAQGAEATPDSTVRPLAVSPASQPGSPVLKIKVISEATGEMAGQAVRVLRRQIGQRCPTEVVEQGEATLSIELAVLPGLGREGRALRRGPVAWGCQRVGGALHALAISEFNELRMIHHVQPASSDAVRPPQVKPSEPHVNH